jgi:ribosomal-protein-alanine N-acetyltransferase
VNLAELSIRQMQKDDLKAVSTIERVTQIVPWTANIFEDCLRVGYQGFVVICKGEIIGFIILAVAANECHILNIAVSPLEQGQGIGFWLMQHVLEVLKLQTVNAVFLEVRVSNVKAQKLYQKLSFAEIGRRVNYYQAKQGREDAIVMSLALNN